MPYTPEEVKEMRRLMGITDEPEQMRIDTSLPAGIADITAVYICLENISCVDADGNITENHPKLYVKKDIERKADGTFIRFTPYKGITHFEQQGNGLFVPSMALSCRILDIAWQNKGNPEFAKILEQYKDYGPGYGWHCQNTLVDYAGQMIIYYPFDADFTSHGGTSGINTGKKIILPFSKNGLKSAALEDALNNANTARFVRQFTGLQNPAVLIEIGKYFGKPARLWFPGNDATNCNQTRAAWLGCDNNNFSLNANEYRNNNVVAARGVRRGER
ncbi:MAG: hypothetical protein V1734_03510 [Nanoarchaeota archaeon]